MGVIGEWLLVNGFGFWSVKRKGISCKFEILRFKRAMKYILIFLIGLVSVSCSTVKRINDGKYFSNENYKNLSNADLSSNFKLIDTSGYESLMSNCYQRSGIVVDFGFSKIDHSRKKIIDSNYVCHFEHVKKHKYYLKSYRGDELIDSIISSSSIQIDVDR